VLDPRLARRIRLLALDVDGVLTDNAVFLGVVAGQRVEFKRFDIQDGLGLALLRGTDIRVALVSGRTSEATTLRAQELRIEDVIQDSGARKVPALGALLTKRGIGWPEVAFVGDDLADLPVLKRVGLPIAVANAVDEAKAMAAYVTKSVGGRGAVREVVTMLLRARGEYDAALQRYLEERDVDDA
jgi:3-deoxy-D-manno-octulosonate 8-phosphate phosphatase (KDO 8-P phosphatase)